MTWRNAAASLSLHAAQRANGLMADGDMEGRAVWHRIERAIDELIRTAPGIVPTRESAVTVYKPKPERVHEAKTRRCLKCRKEFTSSWLGERICGNCKSGKERRGAGMDSGRFMERERK